MTIFIVIWILQYVITAILGTIYAKRMHDSEFFWLSVTPIISFIATVILINNWIEA